MTQLFDLLLACAVMVVPLYGAYTAVKWIADHSRRREDGERTGGDD